MASVDGQVINNTTYGAALEKRTLAGGALPFASTTVSIPVISNITPAPGAIARSQTVSIDVTDSLGLLNVIVFAEFGGRDARVIYNGSTFADDFDDSSTATPITGGVRLTFIQNTPGWLASFRLRTVVVSTTGGIAVANASLDYTVTNPAGATPTMSGVSPTPPSLEPNEEVVFDLLSVYAFTGVEISVTFSGTTFTETVFKGVPSDEVPNANFSTTYQERSRAELITDADYPNRWRFRILRETVWPSSPQFAVTAYTAIGGVL